jgi:hypothetical protein
MQEEMVIVKVDCYRLWGRQGGQVGRPLVGSPWHGGGWRCMQGGSGA